MLPPQKGRACVDLAHAGLALLTEADLRASCDALRPITSQLVFKVVDRVACCFYGSEHNSLRMFGVCGIATDIVGVQLTVAGFEVQRCKTLSDRESHPGSLGSSYIYDDHQFLLVTIQGQRYIVDPAYIQFLTMLPESLEDKGKRPDILIVPETQFGLWI